MTPWYVWVVGTVNEDPADETDFKLVGVFTTAEKARAAAFNGCFIVTLPVDESWVGNTVPTEWVSEPQ